jgi:hypothetical protein
MGDLMNNVAAGADLIRSTIGSFRTTGTPQRDQSGEALRLIDESADDSTFTYIDNLAAGLEATGRIILSMIPEVYDTERDVRITLPNGKESFTPVNTTVENAVKKVESNPERYAGLDSKRIMKKAGGWFNRLSDGDYAIRVSTGPSYQRQRRDVVDVLLKAGQYYPAIANVAGDMMVQNLPIPENLIAELSRRMRKTLPPGMVQPDPGEPPMPPPPQMVISAQAAKAEMTKADAAMVRAQTGEKKATADVAIALRKIESQEKIEAAKLGQGDRQHDAELMADREKMLREAYLKLHEIFSPQPQQVPPEQ